MRTKLKPAELRRMSARQLVDHCCQYPTLFSNEVSRLTGLEMSTLRHYRHHNRKYADLIEEERVEARGPVCNAHGMYPTRNVFRYMYEGCMGSPYLAHMRDWEAEHEEIERKLAAAAV